MFANVQNHLKNHKSSYWESLVNEENEEERMVKPLRQRQLTDKKFLYIHAAAIIFLVTCVLYCVCYSNVDRSLGFDNCGNVCGEDNHFSIADQDLCKAENMKNRPYLLYQAIDNRECVSNCSGDNILILDYLCIINNNDQDKVKFSNLKMAVEIDLRNSIGAISLGLTVALLLAIGWALAFRVAASLIVWLSIGVAIGLWGALSVFLWNNVATTNPSSPIIVTIITVLLCVLVYFFRWKIELVVKLFKEAGRVVVDVPMVLFQPVPVFVLSLILFGAWALFDTLIRTSGFAVEQNGLVHFHQNGFMHFSFWYNLFMLFWCLQFTFNLHEMVISGVTVLWFFTRNKRDLGYPYLKSVHMTTRFHLGTISLGSLVIVLLYVIKKMVERVKFMCTYTCGLLCCGCCWGNTTSPLTRFLEYISRNAFTFTTLHGTSFWQSGKSVFELMSNNLFSVLTLKVVGGIVLGIGRLAVIMVSIGVTFLMIGRDEVIFHSSWIIPLCFVTIFASSIAFYFMGIYDVIVDALFVSFCEDCKVNDGITRAYFMNPSLIELVEATEDKIGKTNDRPRLVHVANSV